MNDTVARDPLVIGTRTFSSRLLVGTGKYVDFQQTREAIDASGAEIVTVAIRRTNIGQHAGQPSLLDAVPPDRFTILPNTAGCYTAEDAVRTLRLARELLDGHNLVKLEVLGNEQNLFPNMPETLAAARTLVKEGFEVMVYCSDDPIQAKMLEDIGCVAIMPLASLIGSGMGILNPWNLKLILEQARVPVIVDAGVYFRHLCSVQAAFAYFSTSVSVSISAAAALSSAACSVVSRPTIAAISSADSASNPANSKSIKIRFPSGDSSNLANASANAGCLSA